MSLFSFHLLYCNYSLSVIIFLLFFFFFTRVTQVINDRAASFEKTHSILFFVTLILDKKVSRMSIWRKSREGSKKTREDYRTELREEPQPRSFRCRCYRSTDTPRRPFNFSSNFKARSLVPHQTYRDLFYIYLKVVHLTPLARRRYTYHYR